MARGICAMVLLIAIAGCNRPRRAGNTHPSISESPPPEVAARGPVYSFGVPPLRPVLSMWRRYHPLLSHVAQTGLNIRMESAQSFQAYVAKLREGALDFAVVDAYQIILAEDWGYREIARWSGNRDRCTYQTRVQRF